MKTGNTWGSAYAALVAIRPQWSPVMKTGNTRKRAIVRPRSLGLNGARS